MKRIVIITLTIFLLAGCQKTEAPADTGNDTVVLEPSEPETTVTETGRRVIGIIDRTVTEPLGTCDAHEGFHADGEYVYYFPSIKSHYVTVRYSDGSENPLKKALYLGDITIADLDEYGIGYGKQKHTENGNGGAKKIVYDIICDFEGCESDTEEVFYENSDYIYSFPNPLSQHITVLFTDGSEENVMDAFDNSDLVPYDLIAAGIPVWEESKLDGSSTFYSDGEVYYHEP